MIGTCVPVLTSQELYHFLNKRIIEFSSLIRYDYTWKPKSEIGGIVANYRYLYKF